jgi:hypothetical protein
MAMSGQSRFRLYPRLGPPWCAVLSLRAPRRADEMETQMITITSNAKEYANFIDDLVKSQVPFALSKAMNVTAVQARDGALHQNYKSTFDERNKAFFRQVHSIRPSSAGQGKRIGRMVVAIQQSNLPPPPGTVARLTTRQAPGVIVKYSNPSQPGRKRGVADTDFMKLHVGGGTRLPSRKYLTVPFSTSKIRRKKTTGAVIPSQSATTLLSPGGKGFISGKEGSSGKITIFMRKGKGTITPMYSLKESLSIKQKYNPSLVVKNAFLSSLNINFQQSIQLAIKTSKFKGFSFR